MSASTKITADQLRIAVIDDFIKKAIAAEKAIQERPLTKNEETAFRRGVKVGMNFDLIRDGDWEAASSALNSSLIAKLAK